MKFCTRLFAGLLLFQLALYGMTVASHGDLPAFTVLLIPAIWIAMAIGGVHSAGISSFLIGIAVTALFYALVASVVVFVAKVLLGKKRPKPESGQE